MKAIRLFAACLLIPAIFAAGCVTGDPAGQVGVPELESFVGDAAAFAREHPLDTSLAVFSNRSGPFVRGELYIYAYDFNGTVLAHPIQPGLIGVNRWDEQDAMGRYFIRDLAAAAENGSGFAVYSYINPLHDNAVEQKLGYVMKVDDSWWLGSGIYQGRA